MHDPAARPARPERGRVLTRRAALQVAGIALAGTVASGLLPDSAPALAQDANTLKVSNRSKWEIHHLFLSPSAEEAWGPDQLEDQILATGGSLTLTGIACDTYDIKLVDEDGDECIVEQEDLCASNYYFVITNEKLSQCEGFS